MRAAAKCAMSVSRRSGWERYASRFAATRARIAARMWSRAAAARMNGLPGSSVCAQAQGFSGVRFKESLGFYSPLSPVPKHPKMSGSERYALRFCATCARITAMLWCRADTVRMNRLPGSSVCKAQGAGFQGFSALARAASPGQRCNDQDHCPCALCLGPA